MPSSSRQPTQNEYVYKNLTDLLHGFGVFFCGISVYTNEHLSASMCFICFFSLFCIILVCFYIIITIDTCLSFNETGRCGIKRGGSGRCGRGNQFQSILYEKKSIFLKKN